MQGLLRQVSSQLVNWIASDDSLQALVSSAKLREAVVLPLLRSVREQLMPYAAATLAVAALLVALAVSNIVLTATLFARMPR
jgi:hypothetical protein